MPNETPGRAAVTRRIDAHQHFWRLDRGDYGWLTPALGPIHRDFGPADLEPHLSAAGLRETILVQAAETVAETEFLLETAASCRFVAGVVGWADMEAADAVETIARLAADPLLRGIRPMIQDIADPQWMLMPALDGAFRAIIGADLAFDALVRPGQLASLLTLLDRYPDLRVVVDHGAKPDIARWKPGDRDFKLWADRMRAAAAAGACCKLSGLATEAAAGWSAEDLKPYADSLLDAFGPDRLLFGSDWPVVGLAGGYARWWGAAQGLLSPLDDAGRDAVLGENAARFYRI